MYVSIYYLIFFISIITFIKKKLFTNSIKFNYPKNQVDLEHKQELQQITYKTVSY